MSFNHHPPSPCIRNCCLDQNDVCLGCLRTLQEILEWHQYTAEQKQQLLDEIAQRRSLQKPSVRRNQSSLRCFLGLSLDEPTRERLLAAAQEIRSQHPQLPYRWMPPENYHVTLNFLGSVPREDLEPLYESLHCHRWLPKPLHLRLSTISGFPSERHSRHIVAVPDEDHALLELQAVLQIKLLALGYELEERVYRPHITLARHRGDQPQGHFASLPLPPIDIRAERITFFESHRGPQGSIYEELEHFA